eukprot:CAMPEP_0113691160 /NCGR_PEP_ID=MMETSP0038_2-20120614/18257_1 /TAXON_ID=2898 /ORGANISM="Cryptomonas paramecium" /LENGTH=34 /DNA_ID=CAMNT_0000612695 /DNA_START=325 /DNA_END=429 /DNA_ORIENTATION=- /assembly_acc=CAM_ASM_000170
MSESVRAFSVYVPATVVRMVHFGKASVYVLAARP